MSLYKPSDAENVGVKSYALPNFADGNRFAKPVATGEYKFITLEESRSSTAGLTVDDARRQSEQVLTKAREDAKRIRDEAEEIKRQADQARAQAKDLGHKEGYAAGLEAGKAACRAEAGTLIAALKKIGDLYQDLWAVQEPALVKLAGRISEKVILQEAALSPDILTSAFKAALDQLGQQHQAVFHLHPDDIAILENMGPEIRQNIGGLVNISYRPDPKLSRGDVVMETESGRLDGTLRRRLEAVMAPVEEALKARFNLDW